MTLSLPAELPFRVRVFFSHDAARVAVVRTALGCAMGSMTTRAAYTTETLVAADGGVLAHAVWIGTETAADAALVLEQAAGHFAHEGIAEEFREQALPALRKVAVKAGPAGGPTTPGMVSHSLWRATVFLSLQGCSNHHLREAAYLAVSGAADAEAASRRIGNLINWLEAVRSRFDRWDRLPDAECRTTPDGDCVADGPCMHSPPQPASSPQGEAPGVAS